MTKPRVRKLRKTYTAWDAEQLKLLKYLYYEQGLSQAEVGEKLGRTQATIKAIMQAHELPARPQRQPYKKNAGYAALHYRVSNTRGRPRECEWCGQRDGRKRYEWASLTGNLDDVWDYVRLCVLCHRRYDRGIIERPAP